MDWWTASRRPIGIPFCQVPQPSLDPTPKSLDPIIVPNLPLTHVRHLRLQTTSIQGKTTRFRRLERLRTSHPELSRTCQNPPKPFDPRAFRRRPILPVPDPFDPARSVDASRPRWIKRPPPWPWPRGGPRGAGPCPGVGRRGPGSPEQGESKRWSKRWSKTRKLQHAMVIISAIQTYSDIFINNTHVSNHVACSL